MLSEIQTWRNKYFIVVIFRPALKLLLCFLGVINRTCIKLLRLLLIVKREELFKLLPYNYLCIYHSIARTYSLICCIESSLMEPQMKCNALTEVFTATCYRNRVNTLMCSLFQSKSFPSRVPNSQSPETETEVGIRHEKIIYSTLDLIPVIHENKWYVNSLCPWFQFAH